MLEKILEEIEQRISHYRDNATAEYVDVCAGLREAKRIIQNHMHDASEKENEEIEQYRAIGTVDECREAVERRKAKRPDYEGDGEADGYPAYDIWICPHCGEHYEIEYEEYKCCPKCGQEIDWNEEDK